MRAGEFVLILVLAAFGIGLIALGVIAHGHDAQITALRDSVTDAAADQAQRFRELRYDIDTMRTIDSTVAVMGLGARVAVRIEASWRTATRGMSPAARGALLDSLAATTDTASWMRDYR